MAKYQGWVKASVELDIEADSYEQAELIAEGEWYSAMQHSGDFEIEDAYCYEED